MAPEQAGGESIDRRADIWAVGAVLYELLAGRPPIDAPNEVAVLKSLISEGPIDPLPDSVPRGVRDLVMRALSHAPDARYPTAAMMRTAVEDAMVALGLRATSGDVERVVAERLSERIAERRKFIEESVRAVSSQGATAALDIPLEQGSSRDAVSDASVAASTKATSGEMAPSVRARSRYGWAVLGGLVVTAIVGVAIKSESPRARSVESPSVAIIAMSADPAAPKASVISAVGASAEPIVSTWSSATATTASASRRRATPQATARPAHSRDWGGIE
jgi:serine/threonine-protein kinase